MSNNVKPIVARVMPSFGITNKEPKSVDTATATVHEVLSTKVCPACNQPMKSSYTQGRDIWVCLADRVVLPRNE